VARRWAAINSGLAVVAMDWYNAPTGDRSAASRRAALAELICRVYEVARVKDSFPRCTRRRARGGPVLSGIGKRERDLEPALRRVRIARRAISLGFRPPAVINRVGNETTWTVGCGGTAAGGSDL